MFLLNDPTDAILIGKDRKLHILKTVQHEENCTFSQNSLCYASTITFAVKSVWLFQHSMLVGGGSAKTYILRSKYH